MLSSKVDEYPFTNTDCKTVRATNVKTVRAASIDTPHSTLLSLVFGNRRSFTLDP